jgi:hypothetical protein
MRERFGPGFVDQFDVQHVSTITRITIEKTSAKVDDAIFDALSSFRSE